MRSHAARPVGAGRANAPARRGRPLRLVAADYLYGAGPLVVRVLRIDWSLSERVEDDIWLPVEGIRISATGVEVDRVRIWVRSRRLRHNP